MTNEELFIAMVPLKAQIVAYQEMIDKIDDGFTLHLVFRSGSSVIDEAVLKPMTSSSDYDAIVADTKQAVIDNLTAKRDDYQNQFDTLS